jgi:PAS domain S-box-containing protein
MAPEQTGRMNRGIDYRSDFYALGVTLFELLTGQLPFQSDDPLALVHCHLAQSAPSVCELRPELPIVIGQIVAKLMAKNAEDRYQSALGLKYDLELVQQQLNQTGPLTPFEIAARDFSHHFLIPEQLYGRAAEVQTLLDAFDRVAQGGTELILVTGSSGIGKTAVVNEVQKPIVRQRGYFIKGKYDQLQRNIPFFAFVQAFRDLMGQLLSENDIQLAAWRTQILEVVGENGQVIIDVIPELERIIGHQPPIIELSGNAAQNRFNFLFQKFIQVFTTAQHPFVMFLDDLQWADAASLSLLQVLMQDTKYLLILGTYRDNEVSPAHPLMVTVKEIGKSSRVQRVALQPLSPDVLNQLVADTLRCNRWLAQPLTDLLHQKTQGYPFFAKQFLNALYEDGFIHRHPNVGYWQCDISQIKVQSLTSDVVEFMAQQLQKLALTTQELLKLAACIGAQFNLQTLAIVADRSPTEVTTALWPALAAGLIIPLNQIYKFFQEDSDIVHQELNNSKEHSVNAEILDSGACAYRFLHDRVQQAAYSLIPATQKEAAHLHIGRLLLDRTPIDAREEHLFQIVNHLNLGVSLIHQPVERELLAELNWQAGKKARASSAYDAAMRYLDAGLQLLSAQAWVTQYRFSLKVHQLAAEVAYLSGAYAKMATLIEIGLKQAKDQLDRAKFYEIHLLALVAQNQAREAIAYAHQILPSFGMHLPRKASQLRNIVGFLTTVYRMRGISPQDLLALPPMSNPYKLAACQLASAMGAAVQSYRPEMLSFMTYTGISLYLRYGNIPKSSMAYMIYAFLLCEKLGRLDAGYAIGKAAIELCYQTSSKAALGPTLFLWTRFITYRKESIHTVLPLLIEAYQVSLEVGDAEYAAYSLCVYFTQSFWIGTNLADLHREAISNRPALHCLQQIAMTNIYDFNCQVVENLTTETDNVFNFGGRFFDETTISPHDRQLQVYLGLRKLHLAFLFQRDALALKQIEIVEAQVGILDGTFIKTLFYFYTALVRLAQYPSLSQKPQQANLRKVMATIKRLTKLAKSAPMNYQNKVFLLEAERLRVLGQSSQAMAFYDRAIATAKEHGYIQEEALANELAARFYVEWGKAKIAQVYMIEAYYGYARWGAIAKVADLEHRYPDLLVTVLQRPQASTWSGQDTITFGGDSKVLDLDTLLKAAQAISREIEFEKLLATLLEITITNVGADKGVLLLQSDQGLKIFAVVESGQLPNIFSSPIPLELSEDVMIGLVNQVNHSLNLILVNDARDNSPFVGDLYLDQHHPKSILCNPILKQGKLLGILYLENRLTVGAFTRDRVEILNFLCAQAAISLENAQLYQKAQQALTTLRSSEARFQTISDNLLGVIFQICMNPEDGSSFTSYVSSGCNEIYEVPAEAMTSGQCNLRDFEHPDDCPQIVEALHQSAKQLTPFREEFRIVTPTGKVKWVQVTGQPKRQVNGVVAWNGVLLDISDRKLLEQKQDRLLTILEASSDFIGIASPDGKIIWMNQAFYRFCNFVPNTQLTNHSIREFHPAWANEFFRQEGLPQVIQQGQWFAETMLLAPNGQELPVSQRVMAHKSADGTLEYVSTIIRDISDRKATEAQLHHQTQQLAQANYQLEGYSQTLEARVAERTEELSQALTDLQATQAELIQFEKMAALGQLTASIAHEINTPLGVIQGATSNMMAGFHATLQQLPILLQRLSPQQYADFLALVNAALHPQPALSTQEERQQRRQFQTALETQGISNAQNIATQLTLLQVGRSALTSYQSILQAPNCHEILQVACNLVLQSQSANNIQQEVDRAAKIVFALKTYSHRSDASEQSLVQITDSLEVALTLYQNRLNQGIEVVRHYDTVSPILCNPDELTQVWVNLIDNALHAMPERGQLELHVIQQANQVAVSVTDSGSGIPEAIQSRIFEPFFTTKLRGEGSGLGMDIVRQIIQKHAGDIQVHSQPGKTTFTVWLPLPNAQPHDSS